MSAKAFLSAQLCGGERNEQIAQAAWRFSEINEAYDDYLTVLRRRPVAEIADPASAKTFQTWAAEERQAWLAAISMDPLLPSVLLPEDYPGREAWKQRKKVLNEAAAQMRAFQF